MARLANKYSIYDRTLLTSSDPQRLSYTLQPHLNELSNPSVFQAPECYISFIIPTYNDDQYISCTLEQITSYCENRKTQDLQFSWEIIIVDGNSKDQTQSTVLSYAAKHKEVSFIQQPNYMGKGACIQAGALYSRGKILAILSSDSSVNVDELTELEKRYIQLHDAHREIIVTGSRSHLQFLSSDSADPIEGIAGSLYKKLMKIAGIKTISDPLCQMKLISREAARLIFPNQHIFDFGSDAELFYIAIQSHMEIAEVPVNCYQIKNAPASVYILMKMTWNILQVSINYRCGIWGISLKSQIPPESDIL